MWAEMLGTQLIHNARDSITKFGNKKVRPGESKVVKEEVI